MKLQRRRAAPFGPTKSKPSDFFSVNRSMCRRRSRTIGAGTVTVRLPAADFGRPGDTLAVAHLESGDVDADRARVEVHVIASGSGKFAPTQGAEGGQKDEGSVARADTVREGEDLFEGGNQTLRRLLVTAAFDAAGVAADQAVVHGGVHDGAHEAVRLGGGRRKLADRLETTTPSLAVGHPAAFPHVRLGSTSPARMKASTASCGIRTWRPIRMKVMRRSAMRRRTKRSPTLRWSAA
ncbi:hypothetical protein ABIA38_000721 [Embleya sp. AB8]